MFLFVYLSRVMVLGRKEKLLWNSGGGVFSDCGRYSMEFFGLVRMEKKNSEIRQNDNHKKQ